MDFSSANSNIMCSHTNLFKIILNPYCNDKILYYVIDRDKNEFMQYFLVDRLEILHYLIFLFLSLLYNFFHSLCFPDVIFTIGKKTFI